MVRREGGLNCKNRSRINFARVILSSLKFQIRRLNIEIKLAAAPNENMNIDTEGSGMMAYSLSSFCRGGGREEDQSSGGFRGVSRF